MIEKKRLDCLIFERGLAPSREKARALIMAGQVYVDHQKADKPGLCCLSIRRWRFVEIPCLM